MSDFSGQVAVVTGGAQGIGGAVADLLAAGGARLALWDLDLALAQEKAAALGGGAMAFQVNVADYASVSAATEATLAAMGRIDIAVNSAGIAGSNATVEDYDVEEFAQIVTINLMGTFHVKFKILAILVINAALGFTWFIVWSRLLTLVNFIILKTKL